MVRRRENWISIRCIRTTITDNGIPMLLLQYILSQTIFHLSCSVFLTWIITLNQVSASSYGLNKPLVIGEFASVCAQNEGIQNLFQYGYSNGYQVMKRIIKSNSPINSRRVILIGLLIGCLVLAIQRRGRMLRHPSHPGQWHEPIEGPERSRRCCQFPRRVLVL